MSKPSPIVKAQQQFLERVARQRMAMRGTNIVFDHITADRVYSTEERLHVVYVKEVGKRRIHDLPVPVGFFEQKFNGKDEAGLGDFLDDMLDKKLKRG